MFDGKTSRRGKKTDEYLIWEFLACECGQRENPFRYTVELYALDITYVGNIVQEDEDERAICRYRTLQWRVKRDNVGEE